MSRQPKQTGMAKRKTAKPGTDPIPPSQAECRRHTEALLDEALEESFPASDPPSMLRDAPCRPDRGGKD